MISSYIVKISAEQMKEIHQALRVRIAAIQYQIAECRDTGLRKDLRETLILVNGLKNSLHRQMQSE